MLNHLALALAGTCLAAAVWFYVPEVLPLAAVYVLLVGLSWRMGRRLTLPNWAANLLGAAVAAGVVALFWVRTPHPLITTPAELQSAVGEAFLEGGFIPYLGPMMLGLLLVRLYRPIRR